MLYGNISGNKNTIEVLSDQIAHRGLIESCRGRINLILPVSILELVVSTGAADLYVLVRFLFP
jgi:hypothetical protein